MTICILWVSLLHQNFVGVVVGGASVRFVDLSQRWIKILDGWMSVPSSKLLTTGPNITL